MKFRLSPAFDGKQAGPMATLGSIGFTIVAATLAGFLAGYWIDQLLGTSPLFMILLLLAGFAAALVNIYFQVKKRDKK